ncbi:MAG: Eco47II family restriction endonuclease [Bacteroidetes bacterium]|uniref:Eco47II family restriction endonuclease n=1 Tax=Candidatus Merdivivens pullistercoris TaxID=2840873 RepID=A0A9D9N9W6_9BACT|nr:Eco47II family restriction endonuclease [Candidatus Merdivivens pullistercoris]
MRNYDLGFISNECIFNHVKDTVALYRTHINLSEFNKNIIDPIKLTFDAKIYGKSLDEIIESECIRQIDKTNTNHIGYFHQNLFRYAGNGWVIPETGFDVINDELHIYAELKNKHNTMNSRAADSVYRHMQNKILHDDKATCMLVEVIATKSRNDKWFYDNLSHEKIRRVSIDKFYGIVFNDELAFFKLCKALPLILDDVVSDMQRGHIRNSVYDELQNLSPDTFKSLYLLAFKTYEGFQNF